MVKFNKVNAQWAFIQSNERSDVLKTVELEKCLSEICIATTLGKFETVLALNLSDITAIELKRRGFVVNTTYVEFNELSPGGWFQTIISWNEYYEKTDKGTND